MGRHSLSRCASDGTEIASPTSAGRQKANWSSADAVIVFLEMGPRMQMSELGSAPQGGGLLADKVVARKIDQVPTHDWTPFVYFLVGQAAWFACVLSAARGIPWLGTSLVIALIVAHLARAARPIAEFKLLMFVVFIGGAWESALVFSGVLDYPSGMVIPGVAPYWIVALWALFAAQFNTTYRWLKSRIWLAPLLGAIAGPLSFRAGAELGALNFASPFVAAIALAAGWAILLPAIVFMSRRWDGV